MGSMGKHFQNPPFRAEHLGSLLRPKDLLEVRDKYGRKEIDNVDDVLKVERQAIKDIVDVQLKLGFHGITDGEYGRHMFWGSFFPGLEGFEEVRDFGVDLFREYAPDIAAFLEKEKIPRETIICTGKIKHVGSTYTDQFDYLASLVPKEKVKDLKLTLAAPNWYHFRYKEGRAYPSSAYSSDAEYFKDIAKAYHAELQELYDHGCRNIQFDDPNLAYFCSEKMLEGWKADRTNTISADELFDQYIKLYNDCVSKAPADMHIGVHLCRGNFVGSRHFSEGGYDRIATKLFNELNVSTYYLEYDTPRAGGFEPLKSLPPYKNVIVGVITSKFPQMENFGEMKERILKAAKYVAEGSNGSEKDALKRMGVSPQCGFASHEDGNAIDRDSMIEKLKLVRKLADDIWPGEP